MSEKLSALQRVRDDLLADIQATAKRLESLREQYRVADWRVRVIERSADRVINKQDKGL